MKLKNKILLASAGLLVLGGSAAATSTFAWYTANRTAGVNATNISAENEASGLKVETWDPAGATMKGTVDTDSSKITYTATKADSYLVDVLSKGDGKYIKAQFDADGSTYVGSWSDESTYETVNTNAIWKHRLGFKVTIDSKDAGKSIAAFINLKALDIKANDGTTDVTSSIRMSIRSYSTEPKADDKNEIAEDATNGHSWYVIPQTTETTHIYSSVTEATEGATFTLKNDNSVDKDKVIIPSDDRVTSSTVTKSSYETTKGYLGDSSVTVTGEDAEGSPIYVIAEVWLEGTATNTNLTGGSVAPTPGTPDITNAGFTLTFGISSVDVGLLS